MNEKKSDNMAFLLAKRITYEIKEYVLMRLGIKSAILRTKQFSKNAYNKTKDHLYKNGLLYLPYDNSKKLVVMEQIALTEYRNSLIYDSISRFTDVLSILDVGCGEGFHLGMLYDKSPNIKFKGIDISPNRIDRARRKTAGKNIEYHVGSADNFPFADNSVDIIYTVHALEQMPYIIDFAIHEFHRVCRKGVILIEPIREQQNIIGKLHSIRNDYVRNIPKYLLDNGFIIIEHTLSFGDFANQSSLIVAVKIMDNKKFDMEVIK